jgi:membrane associated rhomboid family serine protease
LNSALFSTGLMGASGLVFMMILLASFTNHKEGEIPLTFILVLVLFLAKEVVQAFSNDDISQFAHILGGVIGSLFGFIRGPKHSR